MSENSRASSWRKPATEIVTLPSGQEAELRKSLNTMALVRRGVFTAELVAAAESSANGQLEDAAMAVQLADIFAAELFVDPKVVLTEDELDEDSILIDDIEDEDLAFVAERAMESMVVQTGEGEPFRADANGDGPSDNGEVLADDAKPDVGTAKGGSKRVSTGPGTSDPVASPRPRAGKSKK